MEDKCKVCDKEMLSIGESVRHRRMHTKDREQGTSEAVTGSLKTDNKVTPSSSSGHWKGEKRKFSSTVQQSRKGTKTKKQQKQGSKLQEQESNTAIEQEAAGRKTKKRRNKIKPSYLEDIPTEILRSIFLVCTSYFRNFVVV